MRRLYQRVARPVGSGLDKLLGELERDIMEIMWSRGDGSVRDVLPVLNASRDASAPLAYTTVMTVMARLAEKGLLRRSRIGKAHRYEVAETKEEFLSRSSHQIAVQMVNDFGDAAIAGFLSALDTVDAERLARLRQQLQSTPDA